MEDTKLERLLEHPRTARLSLSPLDGGGEEGRENHYHGRTFVYRTCEGGGQDIRLQGLTNRLRQRFYPDYRAPQKKHGHGSSTAAGSAVHRQLEHLVNCKREGTCHCGLQKVTKKNPTRTYQEPPRKSERTEVALRVLASHGLEPVASEVPLAHLRSRLGTSVDLLCLVKPLPSVLPKVEPPSPQEPPATVLVSLKTGYAKGYNVCRKQQRLGTPLDDVPSTPRNHHQLQVMCEGLLMEREYGAAPDASFVLYLGKRKVRGSREPHLLVSLPRPSLICRRFCRVALGSG
jgi:hypothetical protein